MIKTTLFLCLCVLAGCGPGVSREDVKIVFTAALDAWEKDYRAAEDKASVRFVPYLNRAAATAGSKTWKAFAADAAASLGDKAWNALWADLSLLQIRRLTALMKDLPRPAFPKSD
jgi:hypothetical protein